MGLTDAKIKSLKLRAARYLTSDGRGLGLDVTPGGAISWLYRYRQNGKQHRITVGRYPDLSLKAARERRDMLASQVAAGKSPAEDARTARRA